MGVDSSVASVPIVTDGAVAVESDEVMEGNGGMEESSRGSLHGKFLGVKDEALSNSDSSSPCPSPSPSPSLVGTMAAMHMQGGDAEVSSSPSSDSK